MMQLTSAIPEVEVLLTLEPEELAAKILFLLRGRADSHQFHPGNIRRELYNSNLPGIRQYPNERQPAVELAIAEAFAWLGSQGLILPVPNENGANGWWCLSRRAHRFENEQEFTDYRNARLLPKELLHPGIATTVWLSFMRGAYETAVFEAMREVEIAVRTAAGYKASDHGMPMMRNAFNPDNGPLTDMSVDSAERQAMRELFVGAIGLYKNPHSHRREPIDSPRQAIEIILLASHLLHAVDARVEAIRGANE